MFSPLRVAQAQSIPGEGLGIRLVTRVGVGLVLSNPVTSLAVLGTGLAAVYVYNKVNPSDNDTPITQVNIDSQPRPLSQIEKDAGFTAGNGTTSQDVTAPAVSTVNPPLYGPNGGYNPTGGTTCAGLHLTDTWTSHGTTGAAYKIFLNPTGFAPPGGLNNGYGYQTSSTTGGSCTMSGGPSPYNTYVIYYLSTPCGAGYGNNAQGGCTLMTNNLAKLPTDGTCQITRIGNAYSVSNQDPDCIASPSNPQPTPVFTNSAGTLSFYSSSTSGGKPSGVQISSTASQTDISVSTPNADGSTYKRDYVRTAPIQTATGQAPVSTVSTTNTKGIGDAATVVTEAIVSGGGGGTVGGATSTDVNAVNSTLTDIKTQDQTNSTAIQTAINAQTVATQAATQAINDAKAESTAKAQAIQDKIDLATAKNDSWWAQLLTKLGIIDSNIADIKTSVTTAPTTPFGVDQNLVIDQGKVDIVKNHVGDGTVLPSLFSFSPLLPPNIEPPNIQFNLWTSVVSLDISQYLKYIRVFLGLLLYINLPFTLFNIFTGFRDEVEDGV